jgi:hypothetical protein
MHQTSCLCAKSRAHSFLWLFCWLLRWDSRWRPLPVTGALPFRSGEPSNIALLSGTFSSRLIEDRYDALACTWVLFPVQFQFGTDWVSDCKFILINRQFSWLVFCCRSFIPSNHVCKINSLWNLHLWPGWPWCCLIRYRSRLFKGCVPDYLPLLYLLALWIDCEYHNNHSSNGIRRIRQSYYWFNTELAFIFRDEWESCIALLPISFVQSSDRKKIQRSHETQLRSSGLWLFKFHN